ncbi:hypothetical protein KSE_76260t [Kitasatospora setae KM-6054]|uniref:Glyoxalase-like domain-containing protein n=1 Tax=Kitasatospora setae (strain ATCC 33774 / DSM 43861 / JCM 3304 / KCC A-0304 / NBRC 14216 / KM-6054) TaxID=452652 RepID=E4MZ06_KITSK|nr:hypothetical protein KSE_00480t [Kitasatospora setae KM-6054]BAJ33379.1 hypothetical protein KSE_76260t [Kitasatospora setae KM-6054]
MYDRIRPAYPAAALRWALDGGSPDAVRGAAGVDVAAESLADAVPAHGVLLGGPPEPGHDALPGADTARWILPDGRYLRLLAPDGGEGPVARHLRRRGRGLYAVAFEVDDLEGACRRLARADVGTRPLTVEEVLVEPPGPLAARITLRSAATPTG